MTEVKRITHIIIANDAEAFVSIIARIKNPTQRRAKIHKEHYVSGRFFLWQGDNKLVITPYPVPRCLLRHYERLGYNNSHNISPAKLGISLSDAILADRRLFRRIVTTIRENPGVVLSPYAYTPQLRNLIARLRKLRLQFDVDIEPTHQSCWLVDYIGSKSGFRLEALRDSRIPSPRFYLCFSQTELLHAVQWFETHQRGCVIKVANGEGGWGTLILGDQPSGLSRTARAKLAINGDDIWTSPPYIVEEYLGNTKGKILSPSVEARIRPTGQCEITYVCEQLVSEGSYIGAVIGQTALPKKLERAVRRITHRIGSSYSRLGYRGYFDADFIVRKGIPFPVETNVRRTGGTHVYDCVRFLLGSRWAARYIMSCDCYIYSDQVLPSDGILHRLHGLTMDSRRDCDGVILTGIDDKLPRIGFIIVADNRSKAMRLREGLATALRHDSVTQ